ncbi:TonB-dependent receptor [Fulvivirga sp. M361]|uniref:SusC/RagA family TonB-linked outer membrane protein n=1 Tax=Fulvivirga sp. M361 TaxID=2594266 RepID=UPI001179E078|nr:TonB-dependent receptor [Fulvivirga sp. M361]TRX51206.1 TonB-dependent receptor [Fulvivirga sp. M361]
MKKSIPILLFFALGIVFNIRAQTKTVQGTVLDEMGDPLPGASVIIKGTSKGTSTDLNGTFSLEVDENDVLIISFIGYSKKEVAVSGQTSLSITFDLDVSTLQEVVVVAYGKQTKETITSSIVSVESEELKDITTPDVTSMLQGKVAGVQIAASSGSPGATPNILIRGFASLNGNVTPLWVVDGVIQHSVPIVNPSDVASISVLKDASATALYGSRGANGVVIVTTKRGTLGEPARVTVSSKLAMNTFNTGGFEVMDSRQLYDYHTEFGNTQPWFTQDLLTRDNDWIDGGTQTGVVQESNVSFTTATEDLNLYLNVGYYNEDGTVKGNELDRYTFRTNLDYQMNERLKIMPKLAFSFDDRDRVAQAPLYELYLNLPWDLPFSADGTPVNANESQDWLGRDQRNYFFDQQWNYSSSSAFNMSANFDFEFEILPNLLFRSINNFTLLEGKSTTYTDPRSNAGLADGGNLSEFAQSRFTRLTTQMLSYTHDFGVHSISVLGGYEFNDYRYEDFGATGNGIIAGGEILNIASETGAISGFKNDYALQSFFLSADYSLSNRYFAKASIRRDGASNFGLDNQYGTFFSIGAGWNIHNEDFFNVEPVDQLKLRVSYGSVGNRPSSLYPYQGTYRVNTQYIGTPGAILDQFGNPDLGWEKSYETNIALDTRFIDRVNLTLEYYNKNTSDLLYFVSLPDVTGFRGFWENVGGLKNTGFEAAVSGEVVKSENFNWTLGFNIGVNRNEITELFDDQTEIPQGTKIFKVGEDANAWYIRKWLGVDPDNGNPLWEVVDPVSGERTETSNWNDATLQVVGTSTPDFVGGFNTSVSYKGLSLSANFAFSKGGTIYNASRELFDSDGFYSTFNQQVLADGWSRWKNPGDNATHPLPIEGGNNNSNKRSSRYLEDASYLRMTNVTLSYTVPGDFISRLGLTGLEVYAAGDNLLTFTDYTGVDPAVRGNTDDEDQGFSGSPRLTYPIPKRLAFGVNLSF